MICSKPDRRAPAAEGNNTDMGTSESEIVFSKEPFSFLDGEERALFMENVRLFTFASGEILIRGGEMGNMVYFIVRGECGVFLSPGAPAASPVARLVPGDFFGEMAMLANVKRTATVKTLTEVQVAAMDSQKFKKLFMTNPRVVKGLDAYYKKRQGELNLFKKRVADMESRPEQGLWQKIRKMFGL
ncbi:MAG: cyclic nucleotide-binding domain-containing protein [Elusimicrobiota bacterium]|nr:cyclic nucleotide-binding domain-containing protein [Elusimicrobiota bacterium]